MRSDIANLQLIYERILLEVKLGTTAHDFPDNCPYGFWLSPDGSKFAVCRTFEHDYVAKRLISEHPEWFRYSELLNDGVGAYSIMFANKWTRIYTDSGDLEFETWEMVEDKNGYPMKKKTKGNPSKGIYGEYIPRDIKASPEGMRQFNWMKYVCGLYDLGAVWTSIGTKLWENPNLGRPRL